MLSNINVTNKYQKLLSKMLQQDIYKLKQGFITNTCSTMLFSIVIHCVENMELFNDKQKININYYIEKINHGR